MLPTDAIPGGYGGQLSQMMPGSDVLGQFSPGQLAPGMVDPAQLRGVVPGKEDVAALREQGKEKLRSEATQQLGQFVPGDVGAVPGGEHLEELGLGKMRTATFPGGTQPFNARYLPVDIPKGVISRKKIIRIQVLTPCLSPSLLPRPPLVSLTCFTTSLSHAQPVPEIQDPATVSDPALKRRLQEQINIRRCTGLCCLGFLCLPFWGIQPSVVFHFRFNFINI